MRTIKLSDLIKPKKIEVEDDAEDNRYGRFVVEPLERGFGLTIGNSLRRVLLSTLEGSAITSVKIDGVVHEFSTISGIVEDVSEIILNLKEVVTFIEGKDVATLRLEKEGPCEVTAADFQGDGSVQVFNPDLHIASISEGGKLSLEVTIKTGRGYVTSDRNKVEGAPEGTIFIDSVFSPIRRVNLNVTDARVGQRTDYDKLVLDVWTDGSIEPRVAVAQSASIIYDQLSLFVGEGLVEVKKEVVKEETGEKPNEHLFRRIDEIELSVRSANCLENADIKYIGELVQRSEGEMLRTKNFGRKSLNEIKEIITKMGLGLGVKVDNFPTREELDKMSRESSQEQI